MRDPTTRTGTNTYPRVKFSVQGDREGPSPQNFLSLLSAYPDCKKKRMTRGRVEHPRSARFENSQTRTPSARTAFGLSLHHCRLSPHPSGKSRSIFGDTKRCSPTRTISKKNQLYVTFSSSKNGRPAEHLGDELLTPAISKPASSLVRRVSIAPVESARAQTTTELVSKRHTNKRESRCQFVKRPRE